MLSSRLKTVSLQGTPCGIHSIQNRHLDNAIVKLPMEIELVDSIAMENDALKNLAVNDQGTPVRLELMTDKVLEMNNLPEVTSAMMFQKGNIPTSDGLFSYEIFGDTAEKRRKQYALINLRRKYFHPYVFEALKELGRDFDVCASGQNTFKIVDGKLVKTTEDDPDYDPSATGLRWLIEHFNEFRFTKNNSYTHNQYVELLESCTDDQIFISKFIVIPVFYRDANFSGGSRDIPEINEHYKRLIQLVNALNSSGNMGAFMNNTEYQIQQAMVTIRKYGQSLIEGKRGFLKQYVIGRTTVYAARNVITQPVYTNSQLPSDTMIDMFHAGFPIATCCSLAYPFIEHWILDFIAKEFETKQRKQIMRKDDKGNYKLDYAPIGDVVAMYTPAYIEKKTNQYMETYGSRFEPLTIPMADGSKAYILFTGRPYANDPRNPKAPETATRAMTWTDLLYLACVHTLEFGGKMSYITRYPLVDYFGTFPTMMRVTSTALTTKMEIDGVQYPYYPVVDLTIPQDQVSTLFCDTVTMDNIYLKGIGGDYDGDTISEKTCFTEEANQEAFDIMTDVKHFVSIGGDLVQMIENEAILSFYAMTRRK